MSDLEVRDVPERGRFEAVLDGDVVGFSTYQITGDVISFTHAYVEPAHRGHGVSSEMARCTLEDVRAHPGRRFRPVCPFYVWYVDQHPEYADLLDS